MNTLPETLFTALEAVGTVAFAVSGATVALQRKLDIFGVLLLGLTTALGGGCLRDLLLGKTPPVMFREPVYAIVALMTALVVFLLAWFCRGGFFGHMVLIDRWDWGCFRSSGCGRALPQATPKTSFCASFWGC